MPDESGRNPRRMGRSFREECDEAGDKIVKDVFRSLGALKDGEPDWGFIREPLESWHYWRGFWAKVATVALGTAVTVTVTAILWNLPRLFGLLASWTGTPPPGGP